VIVALLATRKRIVEAFAGVQVALNADSGVEARRKARQGKALAERRYQAGAGDLLDAQRTSIPQRSRAPSCAWHVCKEAFRGAGTGGEFAGQAAACAR